MECSRHSQERLTGGGIDIIHQSDLQLNCRSDVHVDSFPELLVGEDIRASYSCTYQNDLQVYLSERLTGVIIKRLTGALVEQLTGALVAATHKCTWPSDFKVYLSERIISNSQVNLLERRTGALIRATYMWKKPVSRDSFEGPSPGLGRKRYRIERRGGTNKQKIPTAYPVSVTRAAASEGTAITCSRRDQLRSHRRAPGSADRSPRRTSSRCRTRATRRSSSRSARSTRP